MSGISNGCCLPTCSTTTRTGLISDLRRTRQQVGPQQSALGLSARFSLFRDSVACTIVMRWQLRLKSYFSEDPTLFLEPGRGTVHVFCELSRRVTTQPAIPDRRAYVKRKQILLMQGATIWRTTGRSLKPLRTRSPTTARSCGIT